MGMKDILPPDLLQEMLDNGVKFDENGEIIEDEDLLDSQEDDQDEDQDSDTEDSFEEDSDDDTEDDDSEDDTEEDAVKPTKSAKKVNLEKELADDEEEEKPRFKLTPKTSTPDSSTEEVSQLRREIEELKALLKDNKPAPAPEKETDSLATLREEAAQFKKMRMQEFARSVESTVNSMFPDTSFKEIISSVEWQDYQNSRVMGSRVGDLYLTTVRSGETSDVASFFSDFVDRFLPSLSQAKPIAAAMKKAVKPKADKPNLKDLALPDKAKAAVTKPKRSGFDYLESDYTKMLDRAEKGKITLEDFGKFEDKFLKAEREGRVKKD